jgi:glycerol-3-phosphate acyltransferase PlsY
VAVAAGVFSVLAPIATLAAALVFVLAVWMTRIVSLGSIAATITLPSVVWLSGAPVEVLAAASGVGGLILFRHRGNIRRLASGNERRLGDRI